jgi:hypothetical protein
LHPSYWRRFCRSQYPSSTTRDWLNNYVDDEKIGTSIPHYLPPSASNGHGDTIMSHLIDLWESDPEWIWKLEPLSLSWVGFITGEGPFETSIVPGVNYRAAIMVFEGQDEAT